MKIYEFNWQPEKDWVFAPNINAAREFYISFTECVDLNECIVKSIAKKDWINHYILDMNECEPDPDEIKYDEDDYMCGYKIEMSFKEYAEKHIHIDFIGTTEF